MAGPEVASRPCLRCKNPDAPYQLRNVAACQDCFIDYVDSKAVKRLTVLQRETRTSSRPEPRRYVAGLSFGPSSTVLTQILDKQARYHASRKGSSPFEPLVIHIDTDLSHHNTTTPAQKLLAKYRERFPNVSFECVHLSKVFSLKTIDWTTLPAITAPAAEGENDTERLRRFFASLPSVTSRADCLRLFVRHLLLSVAMERSYSALLFGHSTTALASLTLSEVANGRGFAVPWQINDGPFTVCTYGGADETDVGGQGRDDAKVQFPIYYPLREILKAEVMTYLSTTPSVQELVPSDNAPSSVVSHKDQSIEEVMARYFEGVEGPYSGIVTNVVRTAGKLDRLVTSRYCRLCGITLDDEGDSTWAGELGDDPAEGGVSSDEGKLCYGCKRSLGG
ncbi:Cytoplasmic tRNA 2-thiolation protein 2 [Trichoderma ghanense]|uniref:Cytoplasmic tRNA 2-thiolation protein 2 n=1 Tax=Trichoderma ghanense TaxID=65468 RepID=A0ABY2H2S5_9HYPO